MRLWARVPRHLRSVACRSKKVLPSQSCVADTAHRDRALRVIDVEAALHCPDKCRFPYQHMEFCPTTDDDVEQAIVNYYTCTVPGNPRRMASPAAAASGV